MKNTKLNFSLKDQLFNKQKVEYISGLIKEVYPDFLSKNFEKEVLDKFPELELKQRISHISDLFKKYLPDDFEEAVNILIKSLPQVIESGELDNSFWDFIFAPYLDFVRKTWCNIKYLELSLNSLELMASNFSAEDSIRYFLNEFEEETFNKMLEWSSSENYHLRRLSSEGTRAKLPWCQKINLDYKKTIQILDNLYFDKSRYVTRSVANHLNDISKIDPDLVIDVLEKWETKLGQTQGTAPTENSRGESCVNPKTDLDYIISHSTRTLIKKWDKKTLEFLGFSSEPKIEVKNFIIKNREVKIWKNLEFEFEIFLKKQENLIIDYKIYFLNKSWKLLPKVFKIKKINSSSTEGFYPQGEPRSPLRKIGWITKKSGWTQGSPLHISKSHRLKLMSTKSLYPGVHLVEIVINWKSFWKKEFELIK